MSGCFAAKKSSHTAFDAIIPLGHEAVVSPALLLPRANNVQNEQKCMSERITTNHRAALQPKLAATTCSAISEG
jgi:hypothetical protein